jgi:co-chaperonin GroES (HSP10)
MNNYEDYIGIDLETFSIEEELAKHKNVDIPGWHVLIRLYVKPIKTKGGIYLTPKIQEEEIYSRPVGLVVAISPSAYKDSRYKDTGPWCKLGEWRVFERHNGYRIFIDGIAYWYLPEDAVGMRVNDPSIITK